MQARVDWILIIFGTQVIKKKQPLRPVFPDYLSVSYDYGMYSPLSVSFSSLGPILCLENQQSFNCKQNAIVRLAIVVNLYQFIVDDFHSYFYFYVFSLRV